MAMNISCKDRDRIFADSTPAEWAALEAHSANCAICAEELRGWKALSAAAQELRDYSDSPSLWRSIERALVQQAAAKKQRWSWLHPGTGIALGWQVAAAAASPCPESTQVAHHPGHLSADRQQNAIARLKQCQARIARLPQQEE